MVRTDAQKPGRVNTLLIAGLVVDVIGCVLHIVGMAMPDWSVWETTSLGAFIACYINVGCSSYSDKTRDIEALQAMLILGIICGVCAACLEAIHTIFRLRQIKVLSLIAGILSIFACVFIIAGVIIWGAKADLELGDGFDFSFSFILCIVASVFLLNGGVFFLLGYSDTVESI
ncbi:unnamed protein product [Lymnaea stagnalis]|uniref:Uncharacterized protein n=1 Tax=Lymnaea stagnalis TaxID=6523 RepID=A0AAV2I1V0_LYMST